MSSTHFPPLPLPPPPPQKKKKQTKFMRSISMGKSNTVLSAYTMYRHLQQHYSYPSIYMLSANLKAIAIADDKFDIAQTINVVFNRIYRKHCWKRRKCWLPAFSPFLTIFQKPSISLRVRTVWKKVKTHYHTILHFDTLKIYTCGKHCGKRINC